MREMLISYHSLSVPMLRNVVCRSSKWSRCHYEVHGRKGLRYGGRATRASHSLSSDATPAPTPFRKQIKEEAKQKKQALLRDGRPKQSSQSKSRDDWELTVGIEIHAELDTATKLFSAASTSNSADPNTHVSVFDASFPGSQPTLQTSVLLPAIRAALALNCSIAKRSSFDRKHYFYQDQPAGYQITQYHEPFATGGSLVLTADDGIDPADHPQTTVAIKQIQLEQDTAKTLYQPPSTYLIDFNRVSHPLIEIISMPDIHSPATAAAYVRKVQSILRAVGAVTAGMEAGGMRADVNVSVRKRGTHAQDSYHGYTGLGTRTEIKNLSSVKSVLEAVRIERDRQIDLLESAGVVKSETRGYVVGGTETTKLRSKEGEVDYRYMPDPDIPALFIGQDLVTHLQDTLPPMPDEVVAQLVNTHGLTTKDAKTLYELNDGDRLEYFFVVVNLLEAQATAPLPHDKKKAGKAAANWVLHELGSLLTASDRPYSASSPHPKNVAGILQYLLAEDITVDSARFLFAKCFNESHTNDSQPMDIEAMIDANNLKLERLPEALYDELARELVAKHKDVAAAVRNKGQQGKVMWLVGQMMRSRGKDEVKLEAKRAEAAIRRAIAEASDDP